MEITAEKRTKLGKSSKSLKKEGKIAAVIFGKGMESIPVEVSSMDYVKLYDKAGETDLVDIKLDKDSYKVLIKNTQFDPITGKVIHAEFYKPNLKEKTEAEIPVEVINEELNDFVKSGEGVVLTLVNEVRVRALPTDLPHEFIVDASKITVIGEGIKASQLDYDRSKVELMSVEEDEIIVKLDKIEVVEEEPEVTEAEALEKLEATKEKKPEEGEEVEGAEADSKK